MSRPRAGFPYRFQAPASRADHTRDLGVEVEIARVEVEGVGGGLQRRNVALPVPAIAFADDPAFRGILYGLKKVYLNAILLF